MCGGRDREADGGRAGQVLRDGARGRPVRPVPEAERQAERVAPRGILVIGPSSRKGLLPMTTPISRRTLLKGLGTAVALPWMESLSFAAPVPAGSAAAAAPRRIAFLYVPNGVNMQAWTPTEVGKLSALPDILKPLTPVKDYV